MKKLSIEEKAKAYDEAIKRANELNYVSDKDSLQRKTVEHIFPELKENEDEKMKKELLSFLKEGRPYYCPNSAIRQEWAAWLEKQGRLMKALQISNSRIAELVEEKYNLEERLKIVDEIAKEVCKDKTSAIAFLKSAGIMNEKGELAEQYRQDEYKSVMIQPKFKIGDVIKRKNSSVTYTVTNMDTSHFQLDGGHWLKLDRMSEFELVGKKTADTVEPKFKVGDWVVCNNGSHPIFQVIERSWPNAKYRDTKGTEIFLNVKTLDKQYHLWTIQDAKDGDVLSYRDGQWIFIYKEKIDDKSFYYHALYSTVQGLTIANVGFTLLSDTITLATKEQRDLLFQELKEVGYEWDAKNKELNKIEQSSAEWTHKDGKNLAELWEILSIHRNTNSQVNNLIEWVKDLVSYKRQEWNKEDEEMLEDVRSNFEYNKGEMTDALVAQYNRFFDKIKYLKPQPKV